MGLEEGEVWVRPRGEGGRRLGSYQIRKRSRRGVSLNVRNVAMLLGLGRTVPHQSEAYPVARRAES